MAFLILGQIQPWMIKVAGKIWNGEASTRQLANVNSLSGIPHCLIPFYQIVLFALGKDLQPTQLILVSSMSCG
ncbi:MAG: hypothetical protein AAGF85_08040 [Bacteroidota bacterium]